MANDKYTYLKISEEFYYEFYSEGPKGTIKKIVRYSLIQDSPYRIYNLGFGDWDEKNQDVDDLINTNNNDHQKVLGVVADTVVDFLSNHPRVVIFAKGSTASRTRLYPERVGRIYQLLQ